MGWQQGEYREVFWREKSIGMYVPNAENGQRKKAIHTAPVQVSIAAQDDGAAREDAASLTRLGIECKEGDGKPADEEPVMLGRYTELYEENTELAG